MRKLKWMLFLTFAISIALGVVYLEPLKETAVRWLIVSDIKDLHALEGTTPKREFEVTPYGALQSQPLATLLPQPHFLVLYKARCPACLDVFQAYKTLADPTLPPLYFLSFDMEDTPPLGFPAERFLQAAIRRSDTPFAGFSTPLLLSFADNGLVRAIQVGYDEINITHWLQKYNQNQALTTKSD